MNLGDSLAQCESPRPIGSRNLTLTEQLESKKADLELRLKEVNECLNALKKNPEVEGLFNLIAKVRY